MTDVELSKLKKVLIIRLSSLGDILLTTPFIRSLKNQYPKIEIDFILREEYSDLIKLNPHLNKVYPYSRIEKDNLATLAELRKIDYDLVIDLQNNLRSKKIFPSKSTQIERFSKNSWKKFLLVNFKINKLKNEPQIPVRYANTISGFKLDDKGLELTTDKSIDSKLINKNNLIGFCPGARHYTKRWLKEYFIELGNKLTETGYTIVLFGGKIDKELCADICGKIPNSIDLSNFDDILQTAADMNMCKAVVCNDSGLMHTASAVGTKVIVIFGSTVEEFGFTPYNCQDLILENNSLTCRPCSHIGRSSCPKKHFDCIKLITPDFVLEKVAHFISN
ncbi:MAG: glycosyltransferase family 9 protein [Ignavibacteriales bacterium]|nr:glycosyltransferase family 9 protein [Ignavibacteriales bacterium]